MDVSLSALSAGAAHKSAAALACFGAASVLASTEPRAGTGGAAGAGVAPLADQRVAPSAPHLDAPRPIRATAAALGQGRQRLALQLGGGTVGMAPVVATAARDVEAFAKTLAAGGFVVMRREDVSAAEWRAVLADFRNRLTPDGVIDATGLGAQVEGPMRGFGLTASQRGVRGSGASLAAPRPRVSASPRQWRGSVRQRLESGES